LGPEFSGLLFSAAANPQLEIPIAREAI